MNMATSNSISKFTIDANQFVSRYLGYVVTNIVVANFPSTSIDFVFTLNAEGAIMSRREDTPLSYWSITALVALSGAGPPVWRAVGFATGFFKILFKIFIENSCHPRA